MSIARDVLGLSILFGIIALFWWWVKEARAYAKSRPSMTWSATWSAVGAVIVGLVFVTCFWSFPVPCMVGAGLLSLYWDVKRVESSRPTRPTRPTRPVTLNDVLNVENW